MALLQSLGLKAHATVDDDRAMAGAGRLRQRLDGGDFTGAESLLVQASDQSRERMIYGVGASPGAVPVCARWRAARPSSAWANVQLGASLIVSGWTLRGDSYAEDVDADAWAPFLDQLQSAEDPLHRAADLDPTLAEPYAWLMHSGLGQGAPRQHLHALFVAATTRVPLHWPAHYKYFLACTEKWGGSHADMFAFVTDPVSALPAGHIAHCLAAVACCELALAEGVKSASRTLREPRFASDVTAALHAWLDATPDRLDRKLERASGAFAGYALNHFAVALYLCGAEAPARAVLAALGGVIETVPWCWLASGPREKLNPAFTCDRVCRELGVTASS